jgi:hypothetical protein
MESSKSREREQVRFYEISEVVGCKHLSFTTAVRLSDHRPPLPPQST